MSEIDLTVVVTAHDETVVCGPTMRSADVAVAAARDAGYTVETLVGLDAPSEATAAYFQQPDLAHWTTVVLDERDIGRVRNAMAERAAGRYVAFLDADDLFSENWLAEGVAALDRAAADGHRAIAHPEVNVFFDGMRSVLVNVPQDSPMFTPYYLYSRNYYDTLGMAPREAHLAFPYADRDIARGLSREDFQFTLETLDAGWRHLVVKDTLIFKRRREFSLVTQSNGRQAIVRAVPALAIDRVRDLGVVPVPVTTARPR